MTTTTTPRAGADAATRADDLATLEVHPGTTALITTEPGRPSLLAGDVRFTGDVDEFRSWFAIPGDRLAAGLEELPAQHLPTEPWTRGSDFAPGDLTTAELEQLKLATSCYLFGDVELVRDYRDAIQQYYAPFGAAFYAAARIEVHAGAVLEVRGYPAILDVDEVVVHDGGQVRITTPVRLVARSYTKLA